MGVEAEVSAAICFLLSPGAAFITGVTLAIDGGARWAARCFPRRSRPSQPFEGFHRAVPPEVLKGMRLMPVLDSRLDTAGRRLRRQRARMAERLAKCSASKVR